MAADSFLEGFYSAVRERRLADAESLITSSKVAKEERCDWFIRAVIDGQKEAAQIILHNGLTHTEEPLFALSSFLNGLDDIENDNRLTAEEAKTEVVAVLMDKVPNATDFPAPLFLDFAMSEGNAKLVDLLLRRSVDALTHRASVYSSHDLSTLLRGAVWNGDAEKVAFFLKQGASADVSDLLMAIERGFLQVTECLIAAGVDANAVVKNARNDGDPIRGKLIRLRNCFSKAQELRLPHSSRCRSDKKEDKTLLHVAAEGGHEKVVELLVKNGAKVNVYDSSGRTPVFLAAKNCHESAVRLLREHGAETDSVDDDDLSPLHYFAVGGCVESAEMLLNYGSSVDPANSAERTPLHLSGEFGQAKMARLLLEHGAKFEACDTCGETSLHMSVEEGHFDVAKVLLEAGACVASKNHAGEVPLHLAARRGREAIIKLLLKHGASVDVKVQPLDSQLPPERVRDWTPLLLAVEGGHLQAAKVLLKFGASIDVADLYGTTALHVATEKGHFEVVDLLLDCGANTDAKDENGVTALLIAVDKLESRMNGYEDPSPGHLRIIEALLRFGGNVSLVDNRGRTPLSVAASRLWKPTGLRTLLEYGSPIHFVSEATAYSLFETVNESKDEFTHWHPPPRRDRLKGFYSKHFVEKGVSTSEILVRHVVKMKATKLYSNEECFFAKEFSDESVIDAFRTECEAEVKNMKEEKVGSSDVSYYNILTKNIHRLQPIILNEDIAQTLSSSNYLERFPIYGNILKNHLEKAKTRQMFLEGIASFHFLLNLLRPVPYEIAEIVANKYFSNSDLRKLTSIRMQVRSRTSSENIGP